MHVPKRMAGLAAIQRRNSVLRGIFRKGGSLPLEVDLMALSKIFRQPLREALRVLGSEALIRITPAVNGGPKVITPKFETVTRHFALILKYQGATLTEVFEALLLIEPKAARLVAEHAPRRLRLIIEEEESVLADDIAFAQTTIRLHETLLKHASNIAIARIPHTIHRIFERSLLLINMSAIRIGDNSDDKKPGTGLASSIKIDPLYCCWERSRGGRGFHDIILG